MFEQAFKNIDDVLWKEAGCTTELDYTEQTSWLLFLKYLDDLEQERAMEAELVGKDYDFIIDEPHRWSAWAAPKKKDRSFDHDNALTGDDLVDFISAHELLSDAMVPATHPANKLIQQPLLKQVAVTCSKRQPSSGCSPCRI